MKYYYTDIKNNAQIEVKTFLPLIEAVKNGGRAKAVKPLVVGGVLYSLELEPIVAEMDEEGKITLTLFWEDDGEKHSQEIGIIREESHLVSGSYVYYFSYSRYKSKKLFYIGNGFKSREVFSHRYAVQRKSRRQRELYLLSKEQPYRRNGKEYYRDHITPYGKRCEKYEIAELKALNNLYKRLAKMEEQNVKDLEKLNSL